METKKTKMLVFGWNENPFLSKEAMDFLGIPDEIRDDLSWLPWDNKELVRVFNTLGNARASAPGRDIMAASIFECGQKYRDVPCYYEDDEGHREPAGNRTERYNSDEPASLREALLRRHEQEKRELEEYLAGYEKESSWTTIS